MLCMCVGVCVVHVCSGMCGCVLCMRYVWVCVVHVSSGMCGCVLCMCVVVCVVCCACV